MTVQGDLKIVLNCEVRIVAQVVVNKNSVLLVRKILRALDLEINLCESIFNMLGANLALAENLLQQEASRSARGPGRENKTNK